MKTQIVATANSLPTKRAVIVSSMARAQLTRKSSFSSNHSPRSSSMTRRSSGLRSQMLSRTNQLPTSITKAMEIFRSLPMSRLSVRLAYDREQRVAPRSLIARVQELLYNSLPTLILSTRRTYQASQESMP